VEVARSTDAFGNIYQTTRRHIPERMYVCSDRREKINSQREMQLVISFKKILLRRIALNDVSWLQMVVTHLTIIHGGYFFHLLKIPCL
jgi:hypothetical protein